RWGWTSLTRRALVTDPYPRSSSPEPAGARRSPSGVRGAALQDVGIAALPQAWPPADAETGRLGRGHQPVDGDRQIFDDLLVPAMDPCPHDLLEHRVGKMDRQVGGRREGQRPGALVHRHGELVAGRDARDLARLADAAAP